MCWPSGRFLGVGPVAGFCMEHSDCIPQGRSAATCFLTLVGCCFLQSYSPVYPCDFSVILHFLTACFTTSARLLLDCRLYCGQILFDCILRTAVAGL